MRRSALVAFLSAVAMVVVAATAYATPAQVSQSHDLRAQGRVTVTAVECDNRGSTVEIEGSLTLGDVSTTITFRNNAKGTKELVDTGSATMTITPGGGTLTLPKQPSRGGVGGNPWISFQFTDENGNALGDPVVLGRCIQGVRMDHVDDSLSVAATASVLVQAVTCTSRGSTVGVDSTENTSGVNGLLLMDNNINKVVHQAEAASSFSFVFASGTTTHRKGWGVGGAGGNPLVFLDILDSVGASILSSGEQFLGKCKNLS